LKTSKLVLPLLLALAYAPAQVLAGTTTVLGTELSSLTIFSNTYTSVGATTSASLHSDVYGSILAGGVTTMGSNSKVWGNISTPEAMNVGANFAHVTGNIQSGGVLTLGDRAIADKNITSSGASTIGDHATVGGNMISGGVLTTGDTSKVSGYVASGGAATVGANAKVVGTVSAVGKITISASATTGTVLPPLSASPVNPVAYKDALVNRVVADSALVSKAQDALRNMTHDSAASFGLNFYGGTIASVLLAPTMTVDTTLISGVYHAASWSTTAGKKLTLDGKGVTNAAWVFNITDILAFGGVTTMELINAPGTPSVIWNAFNGYTSTGKGAHVIGTILAKTYVMVGAEATVDGANTTVGGKLACGGIYSATSYVSTGDSAVIDGRGCVAETTTPAEAAAVVPEPGSLAMLLTGLGLLGFMVRRKNQA